MHKVNLAEAFATSADHWNTPGGGQINDFPV